MRKPKKRKLKPNYTIKTCLAELETIKDMEPSIQQEFLQTPLTSKGKPVTRYRWIPRPNPAFNSQTSSWGRWEKCTATSRKCCQKRSQCVERT